MNGPEPPQIPVVDRNGVVLVSARGMLNHTAEKPNMQCPFGIDTPGTRTCGIQEALDWMYERRKGNARTAEGGHIRVVGDAVIHDTIRIPIWPGLLFEADHIIVDMPGGDGLLVGYDYQKLGGIIIGGSTISIRALDGPFKGNRGGPGPPSYSSQGTTGIHVKQLDGGRLDIGMVRFFTRYGIFMDGFDEQDAHAACIDSIILVNAFTSNGVGLRTRSNSSPQGSFCGGNRFLLGHFLGNFYGILLDADTDEAGHVTLTNPTSINNHLFATVERSMVLLQPQPPPDAADVIVNSTACYLVVNAKVLDLRGNQNYLVMPGVMRLKRLNPRDQNLVIAPTLPP